MTKWDMTRVWQLKIICWWEDIKLVQLSIMKMLQQDSQIFIKWPPTQTITQMMLIQLSVQWQVKMDKHTIIQPQARWQEQKKKGILSQRIKLEGFLEDWNLPNRDRGRWTHVFLSHQLFPINNKWPTTWTWSTWIRWLEAIHLKNVEQRERITGNWEMAQPTTFWRKS